MSEPAAARRDIDIRLSTESIDQGSVPAGAILVLWKLQNAIKFARTGGVVLISGHAGAESWWLRVEDDGPGLVIYGDGRPGISLSSLASNGTAGLSLGLKPVRRTVELIEAQLTIDRSNELGGAAVTIASEVFKTNCDSERITPSKTG